MGANRMTWYLDVMKFNYESGQDSRIMMYPNKPIANHINSVTQCDV